MAMVPGPAGGGKSQGPRPPQAKPWQPVTAGGDAATIAFYWYFTPERRAPALDSGLWPGTRRGPDAGVMLTPLYDLLGPNGANWTLVIVSGLFFLVLAIVVPNLLDRYRDRNGPPLL